MRRRKFLSAIAATAAWPLGARAQPAAIPVIGFLGAATAKAYEPRLVPFRQALRGEGFIEDQNVKIEYRWSGDQYEKLPVLAAELVRMQVSVIVAAGGAQTALAAKAATTRIPIVFHNGSDPVKIGLVKSLARPGGNLTGVTNITVETVSKRLELMRELVPRADVLAYMTNPRNPNREILVRDIGAPVDSCSAPIRLFPRGVMNCSNGSHVTPSPRCFPTVILWKRVVSPVMGSTSATSIGRWESTSAVFLRVRAHPDCRWCSRRNLSWLSIMGPPRHLDWRCHCRS
jgi:hypothetical protein